VAKQHSVKQHAAPSAILIGILMAVLGLVCFAGNYKVLTVLAGVAGVYLLLKREVMNLRSLPALLLLGYVLVSGLTRFWAISGKFFLREYSHIFIAAVLFLAVMAKPVGHKLQRIALKYGL